MSSLLLTFLIIGLSLCLAISAFFSASETALFSISPMKMRSFRHAHSRKVRLIANLLDRPSDLLVTILMINVAVNIAVQNFVSSIFGSEMSWGLNVGIPLVLTLILGEVIPKSIAISRNEQVGRFAAPVLYFCRLILGPLRFIMNRLASFLSRLFFFFLRRGKALSQEELLFALEASKQRGIVSPDESKLIKGALKIDELFVKELMRPRQAIFSHDINDPLEHLIGLFVEEECRRVPIIEANVDLVHGVMTSDAYFLHHQKIQTPMDLKKFLQEPFFVPETLTAHKLLSQMQERDETMAIVVDEYGQTSGLITKEDIIEVVVGQIVDKIDTETLYTRQSENVIISSGKLELHDLEEIFDVSIESKENRVTVGGYLIEKFGDIPKSGAKYVTDDLLFHVLSATPTRITRVYIRRLTSKERGGSRG